MHCLSVTRSITMADSPAHQHRSRLPTYGSWRVNSPRGRPQRILGGSTEFVTTKIRIQQGKRARKTRRKMTRLSNKKFYLVVCKSVPHVNGNHWITITTLMNCIDSHCDIVVYYSLYAYVSQATKIPLATLIKTSWKELRIKIANTNKQAGSDDCGSLLYCPG